MKRNTQLTRLQSQHQIILDAAGDGIYGLDSDGKIIFSNTATSRILGWQAEDVYGQHAHDVHHHSYPDGSKYTRAESPIYASLRDGKIHHIDNEVFWHVDGSAVQVEYTSTPILVAGKPDGAVVVFRDISARKKKEQQREATLQELARLKTSYQLILDAAGEGIYGKDLDGRFTFGNAAAEKILGWRIADVLGQKSHEVHHHSYPDGSPYPREKCPIHQALESGKKSHRDRDFYWHVDGHMVPVEYTSTPIIVDGKRDGAVLVFRDITERLQLERQREVAFEEIKQLKTQLEQERDYLRDEISITSNFGEIIGESKTLKSTLSQVEAVAPTLVNVLILGESGVGKELIARAIHLQSSRADKILVKVNCASIPGDLFESEFFGHVKGAFTGAQRDRVGRLQLAAGGTLFLDEVGEIPLSQQGKLLRAIQEHEFERVGDDQTIKVDLRVIAATNRDLSVEVKAGRFREDLFYRLSVFPIEVPSLRERVNDIAPLAGHFLRSICQELGREQIQFTRQQLQNLKEYTWPGNVRELKNVIERAVILTTGPRLRLDLAMPGDTRSNIELPTEVISGEPEFVTHAEFRQLEKANITAALRYAQWQISGSEGAAVLLGIKPSTLTYRMNAFGIQRKLDSR